MRRGGHGTRSDLDSVFSGGEVDAIDDAELVIGRAELRKGLRYDYPRLFGLAFNDRRHGAQNEPAAQPAPRDQADEDEEQREKGVRWGDELLTA